jgi:penicillin amidase
VTILLGVLAGVAAWRVAVGAVPALDGQLSLQGLRAPVEVIFDAWAVPHVYARDSDDAWLVAGYLQARERLWKMELYRRVAAGRLSELFGERTLPVDRRFIALGLRRAAAAEWAAASPRVKLALERHAQGVNAAVSDMGRWRRPVEFQLLGIHPEPWTPIDSLSIGKLMAWRLAENRHGELVRGALARKFGAAEAGRLMGGMPAWAPSIVDSGELRAPAAAALPLAGGATARLEPGGWQTPVRQGRHSNAAFRGSTNRGMLPAGLEWLALTSRPGASNSWVVSGARTESGRPMLANDPHLGIEMPSIWYEMHLVAADLDVAGATIPGGPFVIIGHNQRIAWGLTNSGADVQDFYVEDVDWKRRRYRFAGDWLPLTVEPREIAVRGRSAPEVFEVLSTRHGPLVATESDWEEVPLASDLAAPASSRPLALRWTSMASGEGAGAFEAINRAGTWQEFLAAVRRFGAPSQNFVFADTAGNIGYAMSGLLPQRTRGDGAQPVPGWTGEYEWSGAVDPQSLPARLNPPAGQFVTANAEIDRGWSGTMTRDWTAPFRTSRLVALLGTRTGLDRAAFAAMHADVQSPSADLLVGALEQASRSPAMRVAEPEARTAVDRLRLWDRTVDGRPVVTLYQAFVRALWRRTFADEMDARLFQQFLEYGLSEYYAGIFAILEDPTSRWWDDIATLDRRETRDDIVILAAADAMLSLRAKFGDEENWNWDRVHAAEFAHPLSGGGRLLAWFLSRGPVPVIGDSWTVSKHTINRRRPYGVEDVPSYRQILVVGDWDRSLVVNTTGQSGHPSSPHYFDQNPLWRKGEYRSFPFTRVAVDKSKVSRLLLVP